MVVSLKARFKDFLQQYLVREQHFVATMKAHSCDLKLAGEKMLEQRILTTNYQLQLHHTSLQLQEKMLELEEEERKLKVLSEELERYRNFTPSIQQIFDSSDQSIQEIFDALSPVWRSLRNDTYLQTFSPSPVDACALAVDHLSINEISQGASAACPLHNIQLREKLMNGLQLLRKERSTLSQLPRSSFNWNSTLEETIDDNPLSL